jgi:phosphatidylserine/phosphatidylglycerophosphate/cardiolipin synthase-like enzyme
MNQRGYSSKVRTVSFVYCLFAMLCIVLVGCDVTISTNGTSNGSSQCQSNCTTGSGAQGVRVFVEPDSGESVLVNAISDAQKSVWVEMYLLSDTKVIHALEDAANHGIDVRVMLEPHPFGGTPPSRTLDQLKAANIKAQYTDPDFALTHEKGIPILRNVSAQL